MGAVIIDVGLINFHDGHALIVSAPTGIFYTAQCGGMACRHPVTEGFYLPIFRILDDIDECAFGCSSIGHDQALTLAFSKVIADRLPKETEKYSFSLKFDYSRINELMEGWWPVIVTGKLHDVALDHKAYLHTGNCD